MKKFQTQNRHNLMTIYKQIICMRKLKEKYLKKTRRLYQVIGRVSTHNFNGI